MIFCLFFTHKHQFLLPLIMLLNNIFRSVWKVKDLKDNLSKLTLQYTQSGLGLQCLFDKQYSVHIATAKVRPRKSAMP